MTAREGARKIGKAEVVGMAPSVNKTPVGSSTPPIPYGVTMKLSISAAVSPNVFYTKCPAFTIISNTAKVTGDEAGSATGVKSGTTSAKAEPITKSSTVRVNGNWAVRHDDLFFMNEKNTVGKLVYPGGGSAPSVSGAGLPADSVPSDSLSLFSKRGLLNKLTEMGKEVAMSAVMGGDPMATLKAMTDPKSLVKNYLQQSLGGLMQSVGPIGSLVGNQILSGQALDDIVNGRNPLQSIKNSFSADAILQTQGGALLQQAGPITSFLGKKALSQRQTKQQAKQALDKKISSGQPAEINPLASKELTASLLKQGNINAQELGQLLTQNAPAPTMAKLDKMHFPSAYADALKPALKDKKATKNTPSAASSNDAPSKAENDSLSIAFNIAKTCQGMAHSNSFPEKTNWQALFK
ncbi:MAG TPA: DUF4150 domain-containing protein [Ghiorsea sp.]|nr:DUF4150 domain-containing protein [Ghiorsea sp.]